jgi:hypothetical protein
LRKVEGAADTEIRGAAGHFDKTASSHACAAADDDGAPGRGCAATGQSCADSAAEAIRGTTAASDGIGSVWYRRRATFRTPGVSMAAAVIFGIRDDRA